MAPPVPTLLDPRGKLGRWPYCLIAIGCITMSVVYQAYRRETGLSDQPLTFPAFVFSAAWWWVFAISTTKRLADIGRSRLWALLLLVPTVKFFLIAYLGIFSGDGEARPHFDAYPENVSWPGEQEALPVRVRGRRG